MLATPEGELAGTMSLGSLTDAVVAATEGWWKNAVCLLSRRFLSGDSVVKTRRIFRKHFNTACHGNFLAVISYSYG
jgi:hypothetical protein